MATNEEQQDQHLRIAYRQLRSAHSALIDSSNELAKAGWLLAAAEQHAAATMVEEQLEAIEAFAAAQTVTL